MKELDYPFDSKYLVTHKKKLKRLLLENAGDALPKKIAILGGSTTDDIKDILELFLLNYGIRPDFYQSEYARYYEDAMFPNPKLDAFAPDIIYIHTTSRNITAWPVLTDSAEEVDGKLENERTKFKGIWDILEKKYACPIIQNNFEMPLYRLMGNMDASDIHGRGNFISRLNQGFYSYSQDHPFFHICDINYISADYGLKDWLDPYYWYMYKYALNLTAIPSLAFNVANMIKSIFGKNKKGFVLDLDNTLWGGVIGDDGVENIELGPEESMGQAYLEFQTYLKEYDTLGILRNVDSKNDYENALAGLNHPDGALKAEDFIEIRANWEPKDENFRAIANDLHLLPESLVFVDDNPAERAIVKARIPGVQAPDIDCVQHYIQTIDHAGFFETTALSADDANRTEMYKANAKREEQKAAFTDYKDFLRSLQMKAQIRPFEPMYFSRLAQLSNKSNQFNLTTRRFTPEEIEAIAGDPSYITLCGSLSDRFGDNGVVSVAIGEIEGKACHIRLWLMSCRVLKRDMEYAMMDTFVKKCRALGIATLFGYYYPTKKNRMVKDFYALHGFEKTAEDADGNATWTLAVSDYKEKNEVIEVEEEA